MKTVALPSAFPQLAQVYAGQGKHVEAEPVYLQALKIYQAVHGENHADVAATLNNLGVLHRMYGQYAEAEPLLMRALAIKERLLGPNHPDVALSVANLGQLYVAQGQPAKAEPFYAGRWPSSKRRWGPPIRKWPRRLRNWPTSCANSVAATRRSPWICRHGRSAPSGVEPVAAFRCSVFHMSENQRSPPNWRMNAMVARFVGIVAIALGFILGMYGLMSRARTGCTRHWDCWSPACWLKAMRSIARSNVCNNFTIDPRHEACRRTFGLRALRSCSLVADPRRLRRSLARRIFQERRDPADAGGDLGKMGPPHTAKTPALGGDTIWTYRVPYSDKDLDPMDLSGITNAANEAASLIGKAAQDGPKPTLYCYRYTLTFDEQKILKSWKREECVPGTRDALHAD